jgi:hypothetical protein
VPGVARIRIELATPAGASIGRENRRKAMSGALGDVTALASPDEYCQSLDMQK